MSRGHGNVGPSKFSNKIEKVDESYKTSSSHTMAIAKPVRALAIISAVLFLYLIYQVSKSPPYVRGPGDLEQALPNEPTLEGSVINR